MTAIERPAGWKANPQAMASVSTRLQFTGSDLLGAAVDPDTWLTPRFILEALGKFDLDPCAASQNRDWVCPASFSREENGLQLPWQGRVFMNPPFSNTAPWLRKHAAHANGISLVPASIESRVWREFVWPYAVGILLLHGRTRFCNPDGSSTTGRPLRSIALIGWTTHDAVKLSDSGIAGVFIKDWHQR